ncbi:MAG: phosphoribosylglycinamide formyltransferase [Verrucomicrobia bacterium]|nr:phosphoribosylglycinamide formyltransferase [Cytophagales bacterium]
MIRIAIFASGSGTNAQKLMEYFDNHAHIRVVLVLSNKSDAPVLLKAANFMVPTYVFDRGKLYETGEVMLKLQENHIDWIVLAGFLWLIPATILQTFPAKVINLHPALLPKFGGKGMYGGKVHEAVIASGEKKSGITIHFADTKYDEGNVIFQASCEVAIGETPESLAAKIHALEHKYLPEVIEKVILDNRKIYQ